LLLLHLVDGILLKIVVNLLVDHLRIFMGLVVHLVAILIDKSRMGIIHSLAITLGRVNRLS
jgi:hypothetical protein